MSATEFTRMSSGDGYIGPAGTRREGICSDFLSKSTLVSMYKMSSGW